MTVQPNGTDARDIALRFFELRDERVTPKIIAKVINQAKHLLSASYTKKEILSVMEYVILDKKVDVYSFGYFSACINDVLREIEKIEKTKQLEQAKEEYLKQSTSIQTSQQSEVEADDESAERNRKKAEQFGASVQSRFREKFDFDLFEK